MRHEVTKFIEAYRDSFSQGPSAIAEFYSEPCVTARMGVSFISSPSPMRVPSLSWKLEASRRVTPYCRAMSMHRAWTTPAPSEAIWTISSKEMRAT